MSDMADIITQVEAGQPKPPPVHQKPYMELTEAITSLKAEKHRLWELQQYVLAQWQEKESALTPAEVQSEIAVVSDRLHMTLAQLEGIRIPS
jgi:hypothetical protein